MGTLKTKSEDDMRRLKNEMEKWMEVREETARQKVSEAEEELKRVLGENEKVKKAIGVAPEMALLPLPREEPFILDEVSPAYQRREGNRLRSPRHTYVHDDEVFQPFEESHEPQTCDSQDTNQITSLKQELEELRLQSMSLHDENARLESVHQMDREIIEGLRLEMQEAITELDGLRTRHIADHIYSEPARAQSPQHEEAYIPPTPSITPQEAEAPHNHPPTEAPAQPPGDICPPEVARNPKAKRRKKTMPTPVEPVLFVDPTNPHELTIQAYQQKMHLLQVKVYSRSAVDIRDIPWPVFPPAGKSYPVIIQGRKQIKAVDVMKFAKAFWIGGSGLAKERAGEMIAAWAWMNPPGRVECTKDLRSWIGRTTTFLHQARERLSL